MGMPPSRKSYKPRLRDYAISLLRAKEWSEGDIGSGTILNHTIEAIENTGKIEVTELTTWFFWQKPLRSCKTVITVYFLMPFLTRTFCRKIEVLLYGAVSHGR